MKIRLHLFFFVFSCQILSGQQIDSLIPVYRTVVHFESDQYELDSSEIKKFGPLLSIAAQMDTFLITINAHTDEIGNDEYNEILSRKRLETIASKMKREWINEEQVVKRFSGESEILIEGEHAQNRRGEIVLYQPMKLIKIAGRIMDVDSKVGISADVMLNTWVYKTSTKSNRKGDFSLLAPLGEKVSLTVSADDYFIEGNLITVHPRLKVKKLQVPMAKIAKDRRYIFKNLNFVGNKSILLGYSYFPLSQLKDFLLEHDDLCVEIEGHINLPHRDSADVATFHFDLSVARALSIKNELLEAGVSDDRMLARGYANWMMKYPKASNAIEQEANRRVTISIRDCEYTTLQEDNSVEDLSRFQLEPLNWKYKTDQVNRTFSNNKQLRLAIFAASLNALKKGYDPEEFTYIELLRMNTF